MSTRFEDVVKYIPPPLPDIAEITFYGNSKVVVSGKALHKCANKRYAINKYRKKALLIAM